MAASKTGVVAGKAFVILEAIDGTAGALRAVERNLMSWGSRLQSIGARIFARGLTAMVPSALGTNVFRQFDDIMRRVQARTNGSAMEMNNLRQQAISLGKDSAFSAREVASLQDVLAQRKFNRTEIAEMTPSILMLGRAAGSGDNPQQDLLNAADLVAQAIMMYEMEAKDAAKVSDIFTAAANESNFALEDLIISMANGGPVAHQYGLALEETLAIMMVMRDLSIDSSVAGTGLRNLFLKASDKKAVGDFNKLMKEMTGSMLMFEDSAGNLMDPASILFSFDQLTKNLGTAQRGHLLAELFGLRAITPATAVAANAKNFTDALAAVRNATGETERAYKTMEGGIGGVFRRLANIAEAVGIALGDSLKRPVMSIGNQIHGMGVRLAGWITYNHEIVVSLTMLAAAAVTAGAALFVLGSSFKIIAMALAPVVFLVATFTTVTRLAVVAGIIPLITGLYSAISAILVFALTTMPVAIMSVLRFAFISLPSAIMALGSFLASVVSATAGIVTMAGTMIASLIPAATAAGLAFLRLTAIIIGMGTIAIVEVTKLLFAFAISVANVAFSVMTTVVGLTATTAMVIANLVAQGILLLAQFGVAILYAALIAGAIVAAFLLAKEVLGGIFTWIETKLGEISESIVNYFMGGFYQVLNGLTTIAQKIAAGFQVMLSAISSAISFTVARLVQMGSVLMQTLGGIFKAMSSGNLNLAMEIGITGLKILWIQLTDFFIDAWHGVVTFIQSTLRDLHIEFNNFAIGTLEILKTQFNFTNSLLGKPLDVQIRSLQLDNQALANKKFGQKPIYDPAARKRQADLHFLKMYLDQLGMTADQQRSVLDMMDFNAMNNPAMVNMPVAGAIKDLIQNGAATGVGGAKGIEGAEAYTMEGGKQAYENMMNRQEQLQNQELQKLNNIDQGIEDMNQTLRDINAKPAAFGGV